MAQKSFLIFHNPQVARSEELANTIDASLRTTHGCRSECTTLAAAEERARLPAPDMLIAVGGDGTMLRVSRLGAQLGCPVLGINLGRVGFLLEVPEAEWPAALLRVLAGDYWLEPRMLVYAEHMRAGVCLGAHHALNEVVITRGALARPMRLKTAIDGSTLGTYIADGLIVASPTGSTAYALAAGGPILPPTLRNIVLIPVAPHLSIERAIVLAEGAGITIDVRIDHPAILSADGQVEVELRDGDQICVRASPRDASFVRLQDAAYFYRNLGARLARKESLQ